MHDLQASDAFCYSYLQRGRDLNPNYQLVHFDRVLLSQN